MAAFDNSINDKLNHKKIAIYIRVSTHWQIDKDSLQVQRRELIAYAKMVLGINDYEIFEDAGYSAKNTDRPDYQRMMDHLRTGEYSHLLVWKIDRISRNLLDFASMYAELKSLGIVFVSKNEQFDTSSAIGEAMLKIILVFAELERNMTSERVTAVMLSRANNGQWNGGRIPYGYDYDKASKLFSVNHNEAEIVKKIYSLYESHQSVLHVVRSFNDAGLKTRQGNPWSVATVHKILTNPFYTGKYVYNVHNDGKGVSRREEGEWITLEAHHEPIISDALFERTQFVLNRNKRGGNEKGETHSHKNVHIFAGLLRCGECGSNMSATLDRRRADGWRPSIYACSKRRHNSTECANKYISDIVLGPFVFNYIANIIRAQGNTSKSTPLDTLQRKLLRGDVFSEVESIDEESLSKLKNLFLQGVSGIEYRPTNVFESSDVSFSEFTVLSERRKKAETALNRLKSLYLYGDDTIPEKDFIIKRQQLTSEIADIEHKLSDFKSQEPNFLNDDELLAKASYFVMAEKLTSGRYVNYEKYIRSIEPSVPKGFLNSIISSIEVKDGRVMEIKFKNDLAHKFTYKSK